MRHPRTWVHEWGVVMLVCFLLAMIAWMFGSIASAGARDAAENLAACRLRFRAARTTADSARVLDQHGECATAIRVVR
jgi:type II secretory pathway pseudopilin PulG